MAKTTQETLLTRHMAEARAHELRRDGCIIHDIVPQRRSFGGPLWRIIYTRPEPRG